MINTLIIVMVTIAVILVIVFPNENVWSTKAVVNMLAIVLVVIMIICVGILVVK